MTTISSIAGQPARDVSSGGWGRRIGAAVYALFDYLERRAATKALHELDDRALRDIGISRCQIEAAVGGALNPGMTKLQWEATRQGSRGCG